MQTLLNYDPRFYGFTLFRADRQNTSKKSGGGVCAYINNRWANNATVQDSHCSDDIEFMVLQCRPFYLPRELNNVYVTVAYVPPSGDKTKALELLTQCIDNVNDKCPEGVKIVLGDFNGLKIKSHVPDYKQFVKCPTRKENILDLFFCNIKNSYKVIRKPPLGESDHNMLYCLPTYRQKLKSAKPTETVVKCWNEDTKLRLQGCFECTSWDSLFDPNASVDYNVDVLTSYVNFCSDMLVPSKVVTVYPNNKPWITKDVIHLLNEKKYALSNNDVLQSKKIQKELNVCIHNAKVNYKTKVENMFRSNNTKDAWKGLKCITGYKCKTPLNEPEDVDKYVNDLNKFYARFDCIDFSKEHKQMLDLLNCTECDSNTVISDIDVTNALSSVKAGKAGGPDGVCAKVIASCKQQFVKPLKNIFQLSLDTHCIPTMWKTSEIIPVPKCKLPSTYNDFRPVALTSIFMKCFEKIIKKILSKFVEPYRDVYQFAYREGRCVEDATVSLLHSLYEHVDKTRCYSRVLFVDFSSAFNTIQPHLLLKKMLDMGADTGLLLWIYNYLTNRPQYVKLNNHLSEIICTGTGAPQGCVLSPLLFTIYTNDCISNTRNCQIIKYADDTAIIGNIVNDDESSYRKQITEFVEWCDNNFLELNVKKTKELIVDFRKIKPSTQKIVVKSENVEIVEKYKYLGTVIDDKLTGSDNIHQVYVKGIQRINLLRILNKLKIDNTILCLFYKSMIQSVLCFSIVSWFGNACVKDVSKLGKVIKMANRMNVSTIPINILYVNAVQKLTVKIRSDCNHPLHSCYNLLPSNRRLRMPTISTKRFRNSFVPSSIRLLNM